MKKVYAVFTSLLALIIIGAISVWILLTNSLKYSESFENDFGSWIADADVPEDPNNPGHPVEWHITRVSNISRSSLHSLKLFIDGRQDDGTIWIETRIELKKHSRVKVSFWLYSEQQSFNTLATVCAFIGTKNPEAETDFYVIGAANEIAGWKKYEYSAILNANLNKELWVAVGISVRWETYLTYYLDDVEIEVS